MYEKDSENAVGRVYGPWTWIVGMAAAAGLMGLMFALATGFT
ncbi:MAG: hypothetical protein AAGL24_19820 [Pseudomonadota bacterium]